MATGDDIRPAWLTLIGIGEDGRDGLPAAARRALAEAELVVGGRRHIALVGSTPGAQRPWSSPIEETLPAILGRRGKPVCVLASGDPFMYGIGSVLSRHIAPAEMLCLPQPSAFSLAASRLGWAQQDCGPVTLHGRPLERIIPMLRPGARLLALSWDARTPARLAVLLARRGFGGSRLTVCEAMGGPRERLRSTVASSFGLGDIDALNTIALDVVADAGARVQPLTPGLPDDWFEHDGQITKARVRAVTLAALAPRPGELLWDVGAGSGSVGIEWMLADPGNRTIAVEPRPERTARIARNAAELGVPDLRIVEGRAPDALHELPIPDAVFIGGGATTPGVIDLCRDAVRPGGRLVANAVTLETQMELAAAFTAHGGDLTALSLAQADPVGRFHGWRPAMPMTQWVWVKS